MSTASGRTVELTAQEKRALLAQLLQQKAQPPTFPLSYGQQALWLTHQLAPESWAYHVVFSVRIRSEVDVAALQRAVQALSERHPALRTTYSAHHGTPEQSVQTRVQVAFAAIDASGWSQDALYQRLLTEARQPFDLERGPVMRVRLLTCSAREHMLLLVVHHIAIDMWSLGLLLDELRVLYPAEKMGVPASLPVLERYYLDYVRQQANRLAGPEGERLWAFWQHQLAGATPALALPTDRPRPPVQTYVGATHAFALSAQLTQQLKALAQAADVTLYMTLLAAFYVLLYRYTGQEDILVGTPTANRMQPEYRRVVGYFANPVVLRAQIVGNTSFRSLLRQTRDTVQKALAHQHYPFSLLLERLQAPRDVSRSPLFQVLFVLQQLHGREDLMTCFVPGTRGAEIDFGGLVLEPLALPQEEGQFDLTLEMAEVGESLLGGIKYNTDLFDAATISRMAGHLQTLLEGIVAHPEQRIATLPLLTAAERYQQLVEWNTTRTDYPQDQCLHQLFEAQVVRTPEAIAVVFEDEQLPYRELNRRANQLAHYLQSLGVGPEVPVGICVERSLDMLVGLLGILKAGGAYVPLDPAYPQDRLSFLLEDAQVPVLLTQTRFEALLPKHGAQMVCLDADWGIVTQGSNEENPCSETTAENLAYVIYTSGSTGKPKGTLIPHRGVVNYLTWCTQRYTIETGQGAPIQSSIAFDLTVTSLFAPLLVGQRVVLLSETVGAANLGIALRDYENFSFIKLTPAHLELLGQQLPAQKAARLTRTLVVGGEALASEKVALWQNKVPDLVLFNEYGPTETVVGCCVYQVPIGKHASGSIPIGRPLPNTQLYLLDSHLQPVPIGVPGELYVGGVGLARGYLNRPELTAEQFIPHPFSDAPDARLYKTGDLAHYLPDGNLEFLGRIDRQVKLRGFRIEPGEIEAVLEQHPALREALVLVREDVPGDKRLVAYLVPAQKPFPSLRELRHALQKKLPNYMIPSTFVMLDAFPLTPNGKVDHRALPAPEQARLESDTALAMPRTPREESLAEMWRQVLGLEQVGIYDNFFELGGHSMRAVQLMNRIHQTFGSDLPLTTLFWASTIASLALLLEDTADFSARCLVPIQAHGTRPPLFCLHPAGGQVLVYHALTTYLGPDQPVYGLQSRALTATTQEHTTVDDMAVAYATDICQQQPEGPYYLLGWSLGGILTMAVAKVLESQGQRVAFAGLCDTYLPILDDGIWHDCILELAMAFGGPVASALTTLDPVAQQALRGELLPLSLIERLQWIINWSRERQLLSADFPLAVLQRQASLAMAHLALCMDCQVVPIQAPLYVWWVRDALREKQPYTDWSHYTRGAMHIEIVDGNHFSMMHPPHLQALAERLQVCLWAAQAATATSTSVSA